MEYFFTQEDVDQISLSTERIQRIIGKAIGREEAARARRDELKIIAFTVPKAKKNAA